MVFNPRLARRVISSGLWMMSPRTYTLFPSFAASSSSSAISMVRITPQQKPEFLSTVTCKLRFFQFFNFCDDKIYLLFDRELGRVENDGVIRLAHRACRAGGILLV